MRVAPIVLCLLSTACPSGGAAPLFEFPQDSGSTEADVPEDDAEAPEDVDDSTEADAADTDDVEAEVQHDVPEVERPCFEGAACTDGELCTVNDVCDALGVCVGVPIECDDGDPCSIDECVVLLGVCDHSPATGVPCDDGDPCTFPDQCDFGKCKARGGECPPCASTADCAELDDDDKCNGALVCVDTECVIDPATVVTCDDVPVTPCEIAVCAAELGVCAVKDRPIGSACEASSPCEEGGACIEGVCEGQPVLCDDDNPCTWDGCDPAVGGCTFLPIDDNVLCNDSDPCTLGDKCTNGSCVGNADPGCDS